MVEEFFDATAEYYDVQYEDLGDREFYRELAIEADGPVLEVGCGTGRIYLDLLAAGVDADGFDLSEGMLDVLREKAGERGLEPNVWQADVTAFEPPREYALAIVPFRAFLHLLSLADQRAALRNLRAALAEGGRLALNFFPPDLNYICGEFDEWQERELDRDGGTYVLRTYTEVVDELEWITREQRQLYDPDGELLFEDTFEMKLVTRREFELLLDEAGFSAWSVYGGFDREPLESVEQELVWIVER